MLQVAEYDDLMDVIYKTGEGRSTVSDMLASLQATFSAQGIGFLVYDEAGDDVVYSIYTSYERLSAADGAELIRAGNDPAARMFYRRRHEQPRRITDIVPEGRLAASRWFRLQVALAKLRHGIVMDFDIAAVRVRFYVMKAVHEPDFDADQLVLVGRICRHLRRAFRSSPMLLAPDRLGSEGQVTLFKPGMLANALRQPGALEYRLTTHFLLTDAEARVAVMFIDAKSRAEAAEQLGISLNTLGTHLRRIYGKMGVRRASELTLALQPQLSHSL